MKLSKIFLMFALSAAMNVAVFGQSGQGRLVGQVADTTGAVVPAAEVKVTSEKTGDERTVTTNENGLYVVTNLAPASYRVVTKSGGLGPTEYTGITITAGQERNLNLVLQPASMTQEVTVNGGELAVIDTSSARVGANVNEREVATLPLNGRQLSQLYLLAPGAQTAGGGSFDNIRFSGRSNQQNVIKIDGVSAGSIIDSSPGNLNGESSSNFRLQSSLENVQEFRVESSNYPAEFGTGTGGQVTVVTKSGGNAVHGGVFEYVRNNAFDARNFFDGNTKSPLRLNQWGGSIGGPIKKDKLFFFAALENLSQRAGVNLVETVPSVSARATATANAATNPKIAAVLPLINAYPVGTTPSSNSLLDIAYLNSASRVDEHYGSMRLDYRASDKNSFGLRYFRDQGESFDPLSVTGRGQAFTAVPQNAMLNWTRILSPTMINEVKVGLNAYKTRSSGVVAPVAGLDLASLAVSFTGSVAIPGIASQGASAGAATLGGLIRANSAYNTRQQPYTNWETPIMDTFSWVKGNHNVKLGAEIRPLRLKTDRFAGTTYTFNSIGDLLNNNPASIQFNADASSPSPWNGGATGPRHLANQFDIFYAQDEWKLTPELTLSYGLRYEYFGVMHEQDNRNVNFNVVTGQIDPSDTPYYQSSKLNFAPRLGISFAPKALKQNTVFRIGGGYFFGNGQGEDQIQPAESDRISRTLSSNIAFPLNTQSVVDNYDINSPTLGFQPRAYAPGYKIPEQILSYTFSVQQVLPTGTLLTAAYVGSQGRNLFLRSIANKITNVGTNPTTGAAIVTREFGGRFAEIDYKTSGGNDHYNSLQTTINRRFSKGLTFGVAHTWGRSIGNSEGSNEALTAANNYSFAADYGNNLYDVRHSVNATALYELPIGQGKAVRLSGAADKILGGWEVGGVVNYRTGVPIDLRITRADVVYQDTRDGKIYTSPVVTNGHVWTQAVINTPGGGASRGVRRPDAVAGVSPYITGQDKRIYLNPAAFMIPSPGSFGNLGRNAYVGPSLSQLDFTVHKRINFTERVNLEFRGEIYNLFNRANFANPPATLAAGLPSSPTSTTGIQPGNPYTGSAAGGAFGRASSTVATTVGLGAQRQAQLSLRLNF
ncbi:MAG: TonB-dependent receptor [Bryobacteraceae bacterium]